MGRPRGTPSTCSACGRPGHNARGAGCLGRANRTTLAGTSRMAIAVDLVEHGAAVPRAAADMVGITHGALRRTLTLRASARSR